MGVKHFHILNELTAYVTSATGTYYSAFFYYYVCQNRFLLFESDLKQNIQNTFYRFIDMYCI